MIGPPTAELPSAPFRSLLTLSCWPITLVPRLDVSSRADNPTSSANSAHPCAPTASTPTQPTPTTDLVDLPQGGHPTVESNSRLEPDRATSRSWANNDSSDAGTKPAVEGSPPVDKVQLGPLARKLLQDIVDALGSSGSEDEERPMMSQPSAKKKRRYVPGGSG